mgnify:CR=1 FL=1
MAQLRQVIAAEIQKSRIDHGLQQKELADLVGVTRTSISNIEHGKQALSLRLFCKIADALNENPGELLNRILESKPEPSVSKEDVRDANMRRIIKNIIG